MAGGEKSKSKSKEIWWGVGLAAVLGSLAIFAA
jgi:hypothetical protein